MSEKTYITPRLKEPELVITPMGAVNDAGVKQKRKAIKFFRNSQGCGQYITSDPKEQAHLEDYMKKYPNRMILGSSHAAKEEVEEVEQTQTEGLGTSEPAVKKGRWPKKAK